MTDQTLIGWDRLRHGGLLLDTPRLKRIADAVPPPLSAWQERELRRRAAPLLDGDGGDISPFVAFVLEELCGFAPLTGTWLRGTAIPADWGRQAVTGEMIKPRHLWQGHGGGLLPVFLDNEKRLGVGRGRRAVSHVLQWLRSSSHRLALLTNGRQWRLIYAGLDADAWCEWDLDLWFEEGSLSPQVTALRTLIQLPLWIPLAEGAPAPLLQAVLDSRKGQADLSAVLGERVREAVEILVRAHGEPLAQECAGTPPADIYRAAVRQVMRLVVILFAESRDLLPRDNALYHGSYGLAGLIEELEKSAARCASRLSRSWSAWPRLLALCRLVHQGSHHPGLLVPAYGGELFAPGDPASGDGLSRALALFEAACHQHEVMNDADVHRLLDRITRTRVKVRQGRASTWVPAPVDFSDLSSEYIGILYEGLLDFELKTAPAGDPVIFLALGDQPALPLSRLEGMEDAAIADLLEKMKQKRGDVEEEEEGEENDQDVDDDHDGDHDDEPGEDVDDDHDDDLDKDQDVGADKEEVLKLAAVETSDDPRHTVRTRAETWARRAVAVGRLAPAPRGRLTPERRLAHEETVTRKARQLVTRVILPGEWYLVRWGGTRKGAGTFYTRPGLAVPTVRRTLHPLAYDPPAGTDGKPDADGPAASWTPKRPEKILALKVCDPAGGSGSFPVATLRFLTEALFESLFVHGWVTADGEGNRLLVTELETRPAWFREAAAGLGLDTPLAEEKLRSRLKRVVVERCLYAVDIDPLAVELCRLALWVETMDRMLPFSFLDHKIKCGNSLVGAWFDTFRHYPAMAWKSREGGDKGHTNGVHFEKEVRTKALKAFVQETLKPDLAAAVGGQMKLFAPPEGDVETVHDEALALLERLHTLPVDNAAERSRLYREELLGSDAFRSLKEAMDLWCACWFWPADALDHAPLPTTFHRPPEETRRIATRIAVAKRFFHWELEFPDVFRAAGSGFDALLGNPPWNIAKPSSKEFFSNIDPLYRAYGKQEALRRQTGYFEGEGVERDWLDYQGDFRAQSNFMKYAALPFGDPKGSDDATDRFSIQRGKANDTLHDRWRALREKDRGYADSEHPFGHQGSADINLYKLFLEQAHALLRPGGRLGFIVPSGLYSDHGTGDLRRLFLDRCRWEWLFGFENREKIFDIHRSFKFNPVIVVKGGKTEAIRAAFMRRKLEDWESAEPLVTPYSRAQVERFSPRSLAILEIQSTRDLEILEKIYAHSVLLGDEGPDGWGIKYAREFDMTNDSKLFPPRPKWEAQGYEPDEYSRWLKGDWRPIADLWAELGAKPLPEGERRCAQPPYDRLPIPRGDISAGIILSRNADAWIREDRIEDTALPLYEGRMIGQFDFSQKGWVSGKGRGAKWRDILWDRKQIEPQYLMGVESYASAKDREGNPKALRGLKLGFMAVGSATNSRTMIAGFVRDFPCGNAVPPLLTQHVGLAPVLSIILNSYGYDYAMRCRLVGLNLNYFIISETPLPSPIGLGAQCLTGIALAASMSSHYFADRWIMAFSAGRPWRSSWAISNHERLRTLSMCDAVSLGLLGFDVEAASHALDYCDLPSSKMEASSPKGFWRVDKEKDPELRHTVLTLVAFHDLQRKMEECGGDRDKGIEAFCAQNDGQGWLLPETLRLADYNLGHDARAREPQPVASRLGPRFYDWQLAQSAEESWRECHLHARNLLGEAGYQALLEEIKGGGGKDKSNPAGDSSKVAEPKSAYGQGKLF